MSSLQSLMVFDLRFERQVLRHSRYKLYVIHVKAITPVSNCSIDNI
jgi:hypothetical protein